MQFEVAIHDNRTSIVLSFYRTSIVLAHHLSISMSISRYLSVALYHSLSIYICIYICLNILLFLFVLQFRVIRISPAANMDYRTPSPTRDRLRHITIFRTRPLRSRSRSRSRSPRLLPPSRARRILFNEIVHRGDSLAAHPSSATWTSTFIPASDATRSIADTLDQLEPPHPAQLPYTVIAHPRVTALPPMPCAAPAA